MLSSPPSANLDFSDRLMSQRGIRQSLVTLGALLAALTKGQKWREVLVTGSGKRQSNGVSCAVHHQHITSIYLCIYIYIYIHVHILELVAAQPTELTELPELPKGSTSLHRSVRYVFLQSLNAHGARDRPRSSYGSKPMPTHLLSSRSPRLRQ